MNELFNYFCTSKTYLSSKLIIFYLISIAFKILKSKLLTLKLLLFMHDAIMSIYLSTQLVCFDVELNNLNQRHKLAFNSFSNVRKAVFKQSNVSIH